MTSHRRLNSPRFQKRNPPISESVHCVVWPSETEEKFIRLWGWERGVRYGRRKRVDLYHVTRQTIIDRYVVHQLVTISNYPILCAPFARPVDMLVNVMGWQRRWRSSHEPRRLNGPSRSKHNCPPRSRGGTSARYRAEAVSVKFCCKSWKSGRMSCLFVDP